MWEGVGDRTKITTYWPPLNSSDYHCLSFPFSGAAQPGACGPSLCWDMVLIPASSLQLLNFLSLGLYNNLISTYFLRTSQFPLNSTPQQLLLRSSTGCTCYLHRCISFFWQHGQVGGQYATIHWFSHPLSLVPILVGFLHLCEGCKWSF